MRNEIERNKMLEVEESIEPMKAINSALNAPSCPWKAEAWRRESALICADNCVKYRKLLKLWASR